MFQLFLLQLDLANSNSANFEFSVILYSKLFLLDSLFSHLLSRLPRASLFRTILRFPWEFKIARFNCIFTSTNVKLKQQPKRIYLFENISYMQYTCETSCAYREGEESCAHTEINVQRIVTSCRYATNNKSRFKAYIPPNLWWKTVDFCTWSTE